MTATVLYLSPSSALGGAEQCLLELTAGLDRSRHAPVVICPADGPLVQRLREADVDCEVVPLPRVLLRAGGGSPLRALLAAAAAPAVLVPVVRQIRRIARERNAQLIHSNGLKMHLLGALVKRRLKGMRLVWHIHQFMREGRFSRLLLRTLGGAPDRFITNSKAVGRDLGPRYAPRTRTVLNGVDPDRFRPDGPPAFTEEAPVVGVVGVLTPWKGQDLFLRAAAEVARRHEHVRFAVVGSNVYDTERGGDYACSLRRLADELGIAERVRFMEFTEDVPSVMRALSVVVHASIHPEPFGRVIVEGMACGRPVAAAAAGGVPEIITDGRDGLLYPLGDGEALAGAVLQLLEDTERAALLGAAARETVLARFTVDRYVRQVEAVYGELGLGG